MAVTDRAGLKGHADSALADNTTGNISAKDVREQMKDMADSNLNRLTDKNVLFPTFKTLTGQSIAAAGSTIIHSLGAPARMVECLGSDGYPMGLLWRVNDSMPNSMIDIVGVIDRTDVTINIIAWI